MTLRSFINGKYKERELVVNIAEPADIDPPVFEGVAKENSFTNTEATILLGFNWF
ncbi:MAG: hypothetical protein KAT04_08150 [Methylococcales bacterium]|nr:hypothetical protein [Methylococcales bacterium]